MSTVFKQAVEYHYVIILLCSQIENEYIGFVHCLASRSFVRMNATFVPYHRHQTWNIYIRIPCTSVPDYVLRLLATQTRRRANCEIWTSYNLKAWVRNIAGRYSLNPKGLKIEWQYSRSAHSPTNKCNDRHFAVTVWKSLF